MIIIQQTVGSSLSDLVADEVKFQEETGLTVDAIMSFIYDGADWSLNGSTVALTDYGISFTGTPVATDTITVAYAPSSMYVFQAGKGINSIKLNANFANLKQAANDNGDSIDDIENNALQKNGSNLTQQIIDDFQKETPIVLSSNGNINLTDNRTHFLTLTGNNTNKVILPTPASDEYSHTIVLVVQGSAYSLNIANGTAGHLYNNLEIDTTQTYNVMYIYNKIDNSWYYSLTQ